MILLQWSLSDSKSPHFSDIFLCIRADLTNAKVCSFSNFQLFQLAIQAFLDRSELAKYNLYHNYSRVR